MTTTVVDWLSRIPLDQMPGWAPVLLGVVIALPAFVGVLGAVQSHFYARMVLRETAQGQGRVRVEVKHGRIRGGSHIVDADFRPGLPAPAQEAAAPPVLAPIVPGSTDTEGHPA